MAPIRVALVEDQHHTREGLAVLIGSAAGFQIAGSYGSMEEALPAIESAPPDVVLADIGLRLTEGHSYKSCAEILGLSLDTIRHHVCKIYDRLHVHSRSEAVWKAVTSGMVRANRPPLS